MLQQKTQCQAIAAHSPPSPLFISLAVTFQINVVLKNTRNMPHLITHIRVFRQGPFLKSSQQTFFLYRLNYDDLKTCPWWVKAFESASPVHGLIIVKPKIALALRSGKCLLTAF